jgi:hypothetical protein
MHKCYYFVFNTRIAILFSLSHPHLISFSSSLIFRKVGIDDHYLSRIARKVNIPMESVH